MTDNITLPREVVEAAVEALELEATSPPLETTAAAMAALRAYLAAPTVKESLTHPGYVIGSHWLETAYSRICAGEAEADVLRDIGLVREEAFLLGVQHLREENEALRRDAERYRWLRNRACHGPHEQFVSEYGWFDVSGQHEPGFDAAIDAAMKEDKT